MQSAPRSNPALEKSFDVKGGDNKPLQLSEFTAQSIRVHNPGSFYIVFPDVPGGIVPPYTTGATIGLPPPGINTIKVHTLTPPGYAADTSGLTEIAKVVLSEAYLPSSGGSPLTTPPRPNVIWRLLNRLGNWTSASGQPGAFANFSPTCSAIGVFIFRNAGTTGDFTLHVTGHTSGFDYAAQPGIGASQATIQSALLTIPITPQDTQLDITWTDSGGFTYVLYEIAPAGLASSANAQSQLPADYDAWGTSAPAVGTVGSVTLAASGTKKYRAAELSASIGQSATTALNGQAILKDGAAVIHSRQLYIKATAQENVGYDQSGLAIPGGAGNAMQWTFSGVVASVGMACSIGAYLG